MKKNQEFAEFVVNKMNTSYDLNDVVDALFQGIPKSKIEIGSRVEIREPDKEPLIGTLSAFKPYNRTYNRYLVLVDGETYESGYSEEYLFLIED